MLYKNKSLNHSSYSSDQREHDRPGPEYECSNLCTYCQGQQQRRSNGWPDPGQRGDVLLHGDGRCHWIYGIMDNQRSVFDGGSRVLRRRRG